MTTAIQLEAAIAAWTDLPAIAALARSIAAAQTDGDLAALAETIARAMDHTLAGQIEPAHAQWMSASTAWALRDAIERLARGEPVSTTALTAARWELETLFPVPSTGALPTVAAAPTIVPVTALNRTGTGTGKGS